MSGSSRIILNKGVQQGLKGLGGDVWPGRKEGDEEESEDENEDLIEDIIKVKEDCCDLGKPGISVSLSARKVRA